MTLQATGAISLANIQTEFGGSNPIGLSEYYRTPGGSYVLSSTGNNINIPTSGIIRLQNFYGTQAVIPIPVLTVTSSPTMSGTVVTVNVGQNATIQWTTTNATSVEWSNNNITWGPLAGGVNGSTNLTAGWGNIGNTPFYMRAVGPGGTQAVQSFTWSVRTPSVSISPSTTSVNEGSSVVFTITHNNLSEPGWLNWSHGLSPSDFQDGVTSGTVYYNGSSNSTVTRTLSNDSFTEGTEYFNLSINGNSNSYYLGASSTITVGDSSTTPPPSVSSLSLSYYISGLTAYFTYNIYLSSSNTTGSTVYYTVTIVNSVGNNTSTTFAIIDGDNSGTNTVSSSLLPEYGGISYANTYLQYGGLTSSTLNWQYSYDNSPPSVSRIDVEGTNLWNTSGSMTYTYTVHMNRINNTGDSMSVIVAHYFGYALNGQPITPTTSGSASISIPNGNIQGQYIGTWSKIGGGAYTARIYGKSGSVQSPNLEFYV